MKTLFTISFLSKVESKTNLSNSARTFIFVNPTEESSCSFNTSVWNLVSWEDIHPPLSRILPMKPEPPNLKQNRCQGPQCECHGMVSDVFVIRMVYFNFVQD